MASRTVQLAKAVDVASLAFGEPKAMSSGQKMIDITHADGSVLLVQTPALRCPFGVRPSGLDGVDKWTMDLECYDAAEDSDRGVFVLLKDLQARFTEEAGRRGWTRATSQFVSSLKYGKDEKYPPLFKINVPKRFGKFACAAFDAATKKELDLAATDLAKARVTAILQCSGAWISPDGERCGVSWRVAQIKAEGAKDAEPDAVFSPYAFLE